LLALKKKWCYHVEQSEVRQTLRPYFRLLTSAAMDKQAEALFPGPFVTKQEASPVATQSTSALVVTLVFLREHWRRLVAISAAVTIPCFWHRHIETQDLASHLYNAWLEQLIKRGRAPGLSLSRQWSNVLYDLALSGVDRVVGLRAAEKIVVSAAILLFFWGAFALTCAMARRISWFLLPCLAMFAYGWTFEKGFMNYYISIGLAFWGLAILLRGRGWERGLAAMLAPLIWIAHPLGVILLMIGAAYILLVEYLPASTRACLFAAAALLLIAGHFFIRIRVHHTAYDKGHFGATWGTQHWWLIQDGTNQLVIHGWWYSLLAHLLQVFLLVCILVDMVRRRHEPRWWSSYLLPLELYGLTLLAAALLPSGIRVRQVIGPLLAIPERVTAISAILICCILAVMKPQKWHLAGFATIAILFFSFLYRDTAKVNYIEEQAEAYVRLLPPGQRVIAPLQSFPGDPISIYHIVDDACIDHCFSYANYEPSSGQFHVRVQSENPFVMADLDEANAASQGRRYIVKPQDFPLYEIYQCNGSLTQLCIRALRVGDNTAEFLPGR
jgi:hypothetical protein